MPYKTLSPRFLVNLHKLTVNSLALGLFAIESLSLSLAVVVAIAIVPIAQQQANASTVTSWQFDPETNELVITLPEGTTPKYSLLNPSQIAVDLPNTEVGIDATQLYPESMVRSVGISQIQPGRARIVVDLAPGFAVRADRIQFQKIGAANRWVLVPSIEPRSGSETADTQGQSVAEVPQDRSQTTPTSTAVETPIESAVEPAVEPDVEPASPTVATYELKPEQQLTANDQIRPITVPLVRLPINAKPQTQVAAKVDRTSETTTANVVTAIPQQRTLTFGEPLPSPRSNSPLQLATGTNILLPAGTKLSLLYPGAKTLRLQPKPSQQEILLLQGGIIDSNGNTILPPNTQVLGRFETNNLGSRFVAQSIYFNGRNMPIIAQSESLSGRRPKPSDRSLFRNSGIGGVALFLLSGFSGIGLLVGAAAGVGTTYVAAPQPATIQPGQILEVSLTEDLPLVINH
jgi:AMIN domain